MIVNSGDNSTSLSTTHISDCSHDDSTISLFGAMTHYMDGVSYQKLILPPQVRHLQTDLQNILHTLLDLRVLCDSEKPDIVCITESRFCTCEDMHTQPRM